MRSGHPVPVVGEWLYDRDAPRFADGEPLPADPAVTGGRGGVVVPLRPVPWWSAPVLGVLGVVFVGAFAAAVVRVVRGPVTREVVGGLVLLGVFGVFGAFFLAAVPSTLRASRGGRGWLLTPEALVTTNLTIRWDDIREVRRTSLRLPRRGRPRWSHTLTVGLRDDAVVPEVRRSRWASWLLDRSARRGLTLGDAKLLGVHPDRVAHAIAALAGDPGLRAHLADGRGVQLIHSGGAA